MKALKLGTVIILLFITFITTEKISTSQERVVKGHRIEIVKVELEELDIPTVKQPQYISLGEFLITAYCSCEICCNEYALNRPKDENGNEIVKGSIGQVLTPEYSIAVDPTVIPYGTEVMFGGNTYLAQDRGGKIKGNHIDLYFNDHQTASKWGKKYFEVFILVTE